MNIARLCNHSFISDYLSHESCVVDCGAHRGEFSASISRSWQCKIFGLEPDPRLFKLLRPLNNCNFFQLALSSRKGPMRLHLGKSNCSSLHFKENGFEDNCIVKTISLPEFCDQNNISKIDVLKLDIEGAELEVLDQLEDGFLTEKVVQLTVEFHAFIDPGARPHITRIIGKLKRIGFYYLPFSRDTEDVLFVNNRFIRLSLTDRCRILHIKYKSGIGRLIRRHLKRDADG
jgi:FkbM family methyltransferase